MLHAYGQHKIFSDCDGFSKKTRDAALDREGVPVGKATHDQMSTNSSSE